MSKFWNFKNAAKAGEAEQIELRIDGDIVDDSWAWIYEWFGEPCAAPNAFRNELKQHKGKDITVWIDSNGGSVFAGAGIYNALKEHKGKVTVKIDGRAISAASVIAMAGDEILMSPVGIMMIHNPITYAEGDWQEMQKAIDVLSEVKETIINAYQLKTGLSRKEISDLMDAESWMSAKKAIKDGFANGIIGQEEQDEGVQNSLIQGAKLVFNHLKPDKAEFEAMKAAALKGGIFTPDGGNAEEKSALNKKILNIKKELTLL